MLKNRFGLPPPPVWPDSPNHYIKDASPLNIAVQPPVIGWREWLALPQLGVERIKAKIDTGAKTSTLHAFRVEPFKRKGVQWVRFGLHPRHEDLGTMVFRESRVTDKRIISDSGGHRTERWVITTVAVLGHLRHDIELTLANRDTMRFRVLLGRRAMRGTFMVDPAASYLLGKPMVDNAPTLSADEGKDE